LYQVEFSQAGEQLGYLAVSSTRQANLSQAGE
jgi:hypothetical protein